MPRPRLATPADEAALYAICLATGNAGENAAQPGREGELYGHLYAGPYLALEPAYAWVVEDELGVCGYALGTPDSTRFYARMTTDWLPPLRQRHPVPRAPEDAWLVSQLHANWQTDSRLADWPAHLHVDLLPRAQGRGAGAVLIQQLLAQLQAAGAPGAHLGVDPRNTRALSWYARWGFSPLFSQPGCHWLGLTFQPAAAQAQSTTN
ncbi:GNAT family N-acetyltransferase [Chitinimonas sp.]|uniref:GNAT family N-acetyltransferase n=1 Tax=Chitinimonas sp. TaxID=1934313 RepID=UPI002F95E5C3